MKQKTYVFQTDSQVVQNVYKSDSNYLIEYNDKFKDSGKCAVYFCSNDIYYPNSESVFKKRIIDGNFYEWYNSRMYGVYKHIFIRDVYKQWYITGINSQINSLDLLCDFIKNETIGYNHVTTLGSSAGGYAAILIGSLIGCHKVIAFNPQFEIESRLVNSSEVIDPLIFRLREGVGSRYYDIIPYINTKIPIFYFYSNESKWDVEQHDYLGDLDCVTQIPFKSNRHGIPFLKVALPLVINLSNDELMKYANKVQHPIIFTIKVVGLFKTAIGFIDQFYKAYKKRK